MKLAIISVTNKGALLAERLARQLAVPADVYAKSGRNPLNTEKEFASLSSLLDTIFSKYEGFIFVMATGIVVRVIAAHVRDKRFDPAVVVVDEGGQHAISLLSGHIGGANDLTRLVAAVAGATPVITTATDVASLPAADVLAVKLGLVIEPFACMKAINAAIVNGDPVTFYIDMSLANADTYIQQAEKLDVTLQRLNESALFEQSAAVLITDKQMVVASSQLFLRPKTLAVGIGCRKGTTREEIVTAITDACQKIGRSINSIAIIASTVVKQNEAGLLAAIKEFAVPHHFFANEHLEQCAIENSLDSSNFVKETIGVGNVCEAAALLAGQTKKLLLPKTKYPKVAIAVAEVKLP
ncbi:cobalamin biosynthesis protein CbiG [Anaerosporomusa subterranea]|uniref:Cobalamin biosynthesis protein CbiG n=1 Tax=Anaerosporomusa subterranea TaxID=1794912 RepID=A0A154BS72_ANASB|nr:cobalt-precorrin 5A hydrolase [Anaerosporomusa subterranea]KYZ76715.1 cobalamin biosynthesis protein CbiG [Anaerosporomusa subterranea]